MRSTELSLTKQLAQVKLWYEIPKRRRYTAIFIHTPMRKFRRLRRTVKDQESTKFSLIKKINEGPVVAVMVK
jgi:hypothetical protein